MSFRLPASSNRASGIVLHLQQAPPSCLFTSRRRDLFSVLRGAFWGDVALKVSGGGVTRTNTNKIWATMLQVFESLSKTCNLLPQQNVALKIALCTLLHEATFNATMLRSTSALKIGSCNITFRELKQQQRRRQRERHKFAYLVAKKNSFARPAGAFLTFVHFVAVVSKTTTRNSQVFGFMKNVSS